MKMAHESNGQKHYLEELLLCKKQSKTVVKKSNQKFTSIDVHKENSNKRISKELIANFAKVAKEIKNSAKLEETQKAQKIKQFQKVKSMLESSGMTSINQVSYGTNSITVTNRKNGNMQTEIFGEVI